MKLLTILFLIFSVATISLIPSISASMSIVDVNGASQNCFNPDGIVVIVYANPDEMSFGPSNSDFTLLDSDRNRVDYFTVNGFPFLDLKSDWNVIYDELTRTWIEIPKSGTFYVTQVGGMGDSFEISTNCIPNPVTFEISSTGNKIHLTGQITGFTSNYVSLSLDDYWQTPVYSGFLYPDTNGFFSETFEFTNCSDMNPNKLTSKNLEDEWWRCYNNNYLITHPLSGKYLYDESFTDDGQTNTGMHRFTISHDGEKYEQSFCLGSCAISNMLDESKKLYFTSVHELTPEPVYEKPAPEPVYEKPKLNSQTLTSSSNLKQEYGDTFWYERHTQEINDDFRHQIIRQNNLDQFKANYEKKLSFQNIRNVDVPQFTIKISEDSGSQITLPKSRTGTFQLKSMDNPFTQSNNVGIMNPHPQYNYGRDVFLSEKYSSIGNIPSHLRPWN